jgi:hypothetical protein
VFGGQAYAMNLDSAVGARKLDGGHNFSSQLLGISVLLVNVSRVTNGI